MLHVFRVDTGALLTVPATPTLVPMGHLPPPNLLSLEGVKKQLQATHGIAVRSQYIIDHTGRTIADSAPLTNAAHGAGSVGCFICRLIIVDLIVRSKHHTFCSTGRPYHAGMPLPTYLMSSTRLRLNVGSRCSTATNDDYLTQRYPLHGHLLTR